MKLTGPPARVARQILRRLKRLRTLVPPRVQAACLSTLWNHWTTARRFQQRSHPSNRCVLGCPGEAEDSIEHYSRCQTVWRVASSSLNLQVAPGQRMQSFLLATPEADDDHFLGRIALLLYAAYGATNAARRHSSRGLATSFEMMTHLVKEGVRGHLYSSMLLDTSHIPATHHSQASKTSPAWVGLGHQMQSSM